jgi:hypothetical protein
VTKRQRYKERHR